MAPGVPSLHNLIDARLDDGHDPLGDEVLVQALERTASVTACTMTPRNKEELNRFVQDPGGRRRAIHEGH